MTPQELKNSILQLAIQGKLVEQRPEEGTAEELYKQIQAEKQALIKAGKIKKEKPLPEITEDEIPFEIPEGWKWVRLGDYAQKITDQVASGSFASLRENVPSLKEPDYAIMVKTADFSNGFTRNLTYTTQHGYEFLENSNLFGGELILSNIGSIGKCFIVPYLGQKMTLAPNAVMVRLISDEHRDYLYDFILSPLGYAELMSITSGTAMKKFNKTDLKTILIPLPPLGEQKRIVAKIEELLPLIERYEKAWSCLEDFNKRFPVDMQKSILQMAIQGKLVEQRPEEGTGEELYRQIQTEKQALIKAEKIKKEKPLPEITEDEIPFEIPESWKWVRVANITILNPKNDLPDDLDTGFIPMPCVFDGFRNEHTYETRKWKDIKKGFTHFADGDVGIAKITPCFQNRKSVVFRELPNGYGAGTTELSIVRTISNLLIREYLLWFFKTDYFISNGIKSFTGTAGQQRIHKDYLATCLLPLPPLAEQKRIVARLEELLPLCERLK